MHVDQAPYRQLQETLFADGDHPAVLPEWLDAHGGREAGWLTAFGARRGNPVPPATVEDLWRLYALDVVLDSLLLPLQHGRADGSDWPGPDLGVAHYVAFAERLGLAPFDGTGRFAPVHHEIVAVEQDADAAAPVRVVGVEWPGLLLGDLVVRRAGVRVRGGERHVVAGVADRSRLYWAGRRKHRRTASLADGWGGNSRWRTGFRRDYVVDGEVHYNADQAPGHRGGLDLAVGADPGRVELLVNRCYVTRDLGGAPWPEVGEPWPYHDVLRAPLH